MGGKLTYLSAAAVVWAPGDLGRAQKARGVQLVGDECFAWELIGGKTRSDPCSGWLHRFEFRIFDLGPDACISLSVLVTFHVRQLGTITVMWTWNGRLLFLGMTVFGETTREAKLRGTQD